MLCNLIFVGEVDIYPPMTSNADWFFVRTIKGSWRLDFLKIKDIKIEYCCSDKTRF